MNKKESKYFCTAAKMDKALIELLDKKHFEYITVKEICSVAGVNRSTFYLHYSNTVDVLEESTRLILDEFLSYFEKNGRAFDADSMPKNELMLITPEYVIPYLRYIKDNQKIFLTAVNHLHTMGFEKYYNKMFLHIFNPILERFHVPESHRQYVIKYYLSGATAISMEWLRGGCKDSIDMISEIIINCVTLGYEANKNT